MNIIDQYMSKLEPRALEVGAVACAYMDRVISRLDRIIDNTGQSNPELIYYRTHHLVTAAKPLEYAPVGVGRDCELVHFSSDAALELRLNGNHLLTLSSGGVVTPTGVIVRAADTLQAFVAADTEVCIILRESLIPVAEDTVGPIGPDRVPLPVSNGRLARHGPTAYPGIETLNR